MMTVAVVTINVNAVAAAAVVVVVVVTILHRLALIRVRGTQNPEFFSVRQQCELGRYS